MITLELMDFKIFSFDPESTSRMLSVSEFDRLMTQAMADTVMMTATAIEEYIKGGMTIDEALEQVICEADEAQLKMAAEAKA